jgi:hypothetical protein
LRLSARFAARRWKWTDKEKKQKWGRDIDRQERKAGRSQGVYTLYLKKKKVKKKERKNGSKKKERKRGERNRVKME